MSFSISARAACVFMLTAVAGVPGVLAADYRHTCASANSDYRIEDKELRARTGPAIEYRIVQQRILRHKRGYCVSDASKKQPHPFEMRSYIMLIEFTHLGAKRLVDVVCEEVADGMPAGLECDRERLMIDTKNY